MNLILVHQPTKQDRTDFEEIARRIRARAPDVATWIVDTKDAACNDPRFDPGASTLTVSPMPIKHFRPPRGARLQGDELWKSSQYERLREIGVPIPDWARIVPGITLDPAHWGPYVVVKPELGRRGTHVRIERAGKVRYRAPEEFPPDHPARRAPMLAQRFVYTGTWPSNYRVVTLFGRVLLCWRCEASHASPPLPARWAFGAGGIPVVSNKRSSRYSLAFDADVLELAHRAHRAFPDQPLLGTDIVRDADTGALFVLECNPRGDTWHISSDLGRMIERANGLDFASQFDAIEVAAEALLEETRSRAA